MEGTRKTELAMGEGVGVLELMMPSTSKSKLRKMLTEGRIQVNGEVIHKAKYNVSSKSLIEILERKKALANTPPPKSRKNSKLNVVWEDEAILVVEKPAGLLSIATDAERPATHSKKAHIMPNRAVVDKELLN